MAGTTITGLSPTTFPILSAVHHPPKVVYSVKEWEYIDAFNAEQKRNPPKMEWNPYPVGTMFNPSGNPLNSNITLAIPGLVDKDGNFAEAFTIVTPIFEHSGPDHYAQENVDYHHPWKCHTCGGGGGSIIQKETTHSDGAYDVLNGLDCPACHGTGKEACPMYDMLSDDDQKTEYKAHEDNVDF